MQRAYMVQGRCPWKNVFFCTKMQKMKTSWNIWSHMSISNPDPNDWGTLTSLIYIYIYIYGRHGKNK